jgi:hypothetical protein
VAERGRTQRTRIQSVSPPSPVSPAEAGFLALPHATDANNAHDAPVRKRRPPRRSSAGPNPLLARPANGDESWPWRSLATAPDGFMAPVPGATEALAPNGTGWLLGIGGAATRSYPRAVTAAFRAFPLACLGPSFAQMLDVPGLAGALGLGFGPLVLFLALTKVWADARLRRQIARTPPSPTLADPAPGSLARVRGIILEQPTISSLFRGKPAVLSRNRVGAAEETRGIDFWLEDPTGQRIRVEVRDAFLLDRPTRLHDLPICDPVSCDWSSLAGPRLRPHLPHARPLRHRLLPPRLFESAVGPGDEIEVCGLVHRSAGPEGLAGPGRGTPLYWAIRGDQHRPLLVRRVRRS